MLSPKSLVGISTALSLTSLKPCKAADQSGIHIKFSFQISCLLQLGDRGWAGSPYAEHYASKVWIPCLQDLFVATYSAQTLGKRGSDRWGKMGRCRSCGFRLLFSLFSYFIFKQNLCAIPFCLQMVHI